MSSIVEYRHAINIIHDSVEAIAAKKQFAKRQAFALLNTELAEDTTYVLRTHAQWVADADPLGIEGMPIFGRGDGTYTYRITYEEWHRPPQLDIAMERNDQ